MPSDRYSAVLETLLGVTWEDVDREVLERFLANAGEEGLLWEAKGGGAGRWVRREQVEEAVGRALEHGLERQTPRRRTALHAPRRRGDAPCHIGQGQYVRSAGEGRPAGRARASRRGVDRGAGEPVGTEVLDAVEAEELGETQAGAGDAALHRADGAVHDRRDVLVGQAGGADEEERLALVGGQLRQRDAQIGEVELRALLGRAREVRRIRPLRILDLAAALAVLRMEQVAQDREQPGVEVRAALEPADMGDGAKERVLDEIVGAVDVVRQRDREGAKARHRGKQRVPHRGLDRSGMGWLAHARSSAPAPPPPSRCRMAMSRSGTGSCVSAAYIARSCVPISSRASSPSRGGSGWKKPGAPNGPNPFGLLVWKDIEDPAWQRGDPKGPVAPMEDNGSVAGRFRTIPPRRALSPGFRGRRPPGRHHAGLALCALRALARRRGRPDVLVVCGLSHFPGRACSAEITDGH